VSISGTSISDYALLGDLHTAALVHRNGSLDWLCLPRFDSPSTFGALLDPTAGSWSLCPDDPRAEPSRCYEEDTLVLTTTWTGPSGSARVIDLMPPRGDACDVVRIVEGLSGEMGFTSILTPRFDYGTIEPWLSSAPVGHDEGVRSQSRARLWAVGGPDALWLDPPAAGATRAEPGRAVTTLTVKPGQRLGFVLTYSPSYAPAPPRIDPEAALADTCAFWRTWIGPCQDAGPWHEPVRRSLITLKALTFAPSGGIVAAPTTSLPEDLGGVRNWDYRYCWLRDAAFTLQALLGSGYVEEAKAWREWLVRAVAGDPAKLQIMYGIDGRRRLTEVELGWLSGFADSRPVRLGNGAARQHQLDVWGEVLDALHQARHAGLQSADSAWQVQLGLMDYLEGNWDHPDASLWEVRGPQRHFVHSKVLAWVGVDRMVRTLEAQPSLPGALSRWQVLRENIHASVCQNGFDADRNTFTQAYDVTSVDAALLLIPRVGFLPWMDPRVVGTVQAVEHELRDGPFVQRYRTHGAVDGLPGTEGAFLACSFWLVDALAGTGRTDESREMFIQLLALRNDLGLLAEEWDIARGCQVGNFPQAFSHVGLINSARVLTEGVQATTTHSPA
jgi:GH15 family glucan-1,4-alpha-glucosidase